MHARERVFTSDANSMLPLKRDGEKPIYLGSLGLIELRLGHYPESIKAYEQAIAERPHSAWSRYGLGLAKIRGGQTGAGNADLSAARTLDRKSKHGRPSMA
jgi:tetratricopeptide (TPR) repeat protein